MTDPRLASPDRTPWFVYMLRCADGTLYTGIATDVARRIAEHEDAAGRGAKYLRGRGPFELLAARHVGAREAALRVEHRIKRLARSQKEALAGDVARLDSMIEESANLAAQRDSGGPGVVASAGAGAGVPRRTSNARTPRSSGRTSTP